MRITATVLTAALVSLGLPATPAYAADTTVVVRVPDDFAEEFDSSDDVTVTIRDCSNFRDQGQLTGPATYSILDTNDPDHPLGSSKLGLAFDANDTGVAGGPMAYTATPTTLATYDIRAQAIDAGTTNGAAYAYYYPSATPGADFWVGSAALNLTTGWQTADALALSMSWTQLSGNTGMPAGPVGSGTVAAFTASKSGDGAGAIIGMAFGCGKKAYVDRLRVGPSGGVTTFDFERTQTKTSIAASKSSITAGTTVAITGEPTTLTGVHFSSAQLTLEQKAFGESSFTPVGTATATYANETSTPARILVKPTSQTQYRWVFAGGQSSSPSTSPVLTVKVAPAITIKGGTVKKGKKAKVTGKLTPAQAGISLTLQAKIKGKWVDWSTGKSKANGSYKLKTPKLKKKATVRVVSKAIGGLSAGTSPQTKVKVTD